MKVPRFIREYASYILKELNNSLASDMCKKIIAERIEKYISLLEKGYISIEECIQQMQRKDY